MERNKEKKNKHDQNFQELWNMIKKVKSKNIENIPNETIAEDSPNQGKDMDIQVTETFKIPNKHQQKKNLFTSHKT